MSRAEVEAHYKIGRRIEAEERCLEEADVVFCSTDEEVYQQWAAYQGFAAGALAPAGRRKAAGAAAAGPSFVVIPPGLDFSRVAMPPAAEGEPPPERDAEPPFWRHISRFLCAASMFGPGIARIHHQRSHAAAAPVAAAPPAPPMLPLGLRSLTSHNRPLN